MYFKIVNGAVEVGEKTILEEINMEIKDKDHIAIVGRNGVGKTTLLKALINPTLLSEGVGENHFQVTILGSPVIGYLKQNEGAHDDKTLKEAILELYQPILDLEQKLKKLEKKMEKKEASLEEIDRYILYQEEYQNIGGYDYQKEYLKAFSKNGFCEEDLSKKLSSFSGGELTKINFIKLLLSKPDLLILDEPTNHLDIDAILWLEEYLAHYPKTFVLVSHDRMFINHVANKIYEIEYGATILYHGNYAFYEKEKKARYELALKNYEKQQKEIARLQRIVDRFRYKPSKASMAMSKLKQIERMEKIEAPKKENQKTFRTTFPHFKESGRVVLTVRDLRFGYTTSLKEVSFTLEKGRRLGIVGKNGTGKSTLLKTIMGRIPPLSGDITFSYQVTTAYFDQQFDTLDPNLTVYAEFQKSYPNANDYEIRSALARFLFYEEDINKQISVLSGGEKVRLQLCKVVYSGANFLILDEPTNHLDILCKEKLEEVLESYPGTILFVSHDRYFIQKIADSILDFTNSKVTYYDYSYEDYLEKKKETEMVTIEELQKPEKMQHERLEKKKKNHSLDEKIRKLEKELEQLQAQRYLEEVYLNPIKYQEVENKIKVLEEQLNELLAKW